MLKDKDEKLEKLTQDTFDPINKEFNELHDEVGRLLTINLSLMLGALLFFIWSFWFIPLAILGWILLFTGYMIIQPKINYKQGFMKGKISGLQEGMDICSASFIKVGKLYEEEQKKNVPENTQL